VTRPVERILITIDHPIFANVMQTVLARYLVVIDSELKSQRSKVGFPTQRGLLGKALNGTISSLQMGGRGKSPLLDRNLLPTERGLKRAVEKFGEEGHATKMARLRLICLAVQGKVVDQGFERIRLLGQPFSTSPSGSGNRKTKGKLPGTVQETKKQLKDLRSAMDQIWACSTAFGDCKVDIGLGASGHCMMAAMVIQDLFGGHVMSGTVKEIPHYWNRLGAYEIDLTGDQFGYAPLRVKKGFLNQRDSFVFLRKPGQLLNQPYNKEACDKYRLFQKRLLRKLKPLNAPLADLLRQHVDNPLAIDAQFPAECYD
jgi:hypothetical protein